MTHPNIGSRWTANNDKTFTVLEVRDMNKDLWVGYTDNDKRDYYCRLEAFLERFRALPD